MLGCVLDAGERVYQGVLGFGWIAVRHHSGIIGTSLQACTFTGVRPRSHERILVARSDAKAPT